MWASLSSKCAQCADLTTVTAHMDVLSGHVSAFVARRATLVHMVPSEIPSGHGAPALTCMSEMDGTRPPQSQSQAFIRRSNMSSSDTADFASFASSSCRRHIFFLDDRKNDDLDVYTTTGLDEPVPKGLWYVLTWTPTVPTTPSNNEYF